MQVRYQLRHRPVAPKGNWTRLLQVSAEPITMAITRTVDPERAREVAAWARAGQDLMSTWPGYLGSGWVRPDPQSHEWHMLFRFMDAETLSAWEHSAEREWWVAS